MRTLAGFHTVLVTICLLALTGCAGRPGQDAPPTVAAVSPPPASARPTAVPSAPAPTAAPSPPAPTVAPSATAAAVALPTAPPTAAAPATVEPATATPANAPAQATPAAVAVLITGATANLRGGPGTEYPVIGQASSGQRFPALAFNSAAGGWWQIDAGGQPAWVSASVAAVEGDAATLPAATTAAPAAAPAAAVQVYETTLTIPTYPTAPFSAEVVDPATGWSYRRLDRVAYEASNPRPAPVTYRAVVLENEYLKLILLPELGGRIYQVIFKPTGHNELYQNPVLKPSPWGPVEQGGWLAAGGIEWGLPVPEHGYAWGDPWGHITFSNGPDAAGVTLFMPDAGHLRADVDVILRAGEAAFTIQPRIVNPSGQAASFQFWLDAMLAPGPANQPGPNLRFILPTDQVTVHSRGDDDLPAAGAAMAWPAHNGVDFSRLGNWRDWLGVFERPAAHGPFAGVYDPDVDEGMVRVFPPAATPGSKIFAMGYAAPIDPAVYTDDASAYVELQGGVTATYWEDATLAAGDSYTWRESWYPVAGIGGVSAADGNGAVFISQAGQALTVGLFPVQALQGRIEVAVDGQILVDEAAAISPAQPWRRELAATDGAGRVVVRFFDQSGEVVLHFEQRL